MATDQPTEKAGDSKPKREKHRHRLSESIHERLAAAEVAAEEAASYGWVTEGVEAIEAAVDPAHELGPEDEHHEEEKETEKQKTTPPG
jgi:hypothetical protein